MIVPKSMELASQSYIWACMNGGRDTYGRILLSQAFHIQDRAQNKTLPARVRRDLSFRMKQLGDSAKRHGDLALFVVLSDVNRKFPTVL
jgi:hypothetical protein